MSEENWDGVTERRKVPRERTVPNFMPKNNSNGNGTGTGNGYKIAPQIATIIIQTIFLLAAMLGFIRNVEQKIAQIDAHLTGASKELFHHIETDHKQADRNKLLLHNSCMSAMKPGCHTEVRSKE